MGWSFFDFSSGVSKDDLFAISFLFYHFFGHSMQFREIDHPFTVGEVRNDPLSSFLAPFWIVDDILKLIIVHENTDNSLILFDLFFLISNRI